MNIRIRVFASLKDLIGTSEFHWDLEGRTTAAQVFDRLGDKYPQILPLKSSILYAANQSYVEKNYVLSDGDELALLPPVSGG
ncbi:MAG TPA: MoaD/ThiS family protein [Bdellovibrionota bacterium]|nr:MoaD/ThiS family protein [Bdellovibrionota bacterium]